MAIIAVDIGKYMIVRLCAPSLHNSIILSKHGSRSPEVMAEANNKLAELIKFPSLEKRGLCFNNAAVPSLHYALILGISAVVLLLRQ